MGVQTRERGAVTRFHDSPAVELGHLTLVVQTIGAGVTAVPAAPAEGALRMLAPLGTVVLARAGRSADVDAGRHDLLWLPARSTVEVSTTRDTPMLLVTIAPGFQSGRPAVPDALTLHRHPLSTLRAPAVQFLLEIAHAGAPAEAVAARRLTHLAEEMVGHLVAEAARPGELPTLLERTLTEIARSHRDPAQTPAGVARNLGVSTRRVQRTLEAAGTTPVVALRRQRLATASALLAAPEFDELSIAEIARRSGFRSDAMLRRALAAAAEMPPSALRRATRSSTGA